VSPHSKGSLRVNSEIRGLTRVQLIDERGRNLGVVSLNEALDRAIGAGYDLVEIVPNAQPPVCKILDYGRYRYEQRKSIAETKKNQKTIETKEIKLRPNIDEHDYSIKVKQACRFLQSGNKVKVTLRFRGREADHSDIGVRILERMREDVDVVGKVELEPRMEGRLVIALFSPR